MFFDFHQLINPSYLFDTNPPYQWDFLWRAIGIYGALIIVAIMIKIFLRSPDYEKIKNSLFTLGLTCGLIGLLLVFFRFEGISFLSARFWHLILLLVFLIWLAIIIFYSIKKLPEEIKERKEKEWREKFLPQPKQKKIR